MRGLGRAYGTKPISGKRGDGPSSRWSSWPFRKRPKNAARYACSAGTAARRGYDGEVSVATAGLVLDIS